MITDAAVKTNNMIVLGRRHADCYETLWTIYHKMISGCDGFWTDDNRFLDRMEARDYAFECGQINKKPNGPLFSEDLW